MPSRIFMICNSYESGFGHGAKADGLDLSKTPHGDPELGEAYQIGYEEGLERGNSSIVRQLLAEIADLRAELAAPKVPAGWSLTEEMIQAACSESLSWDVHLNHADIRDLVKVLLAAAPKGE